MKEKNRKGAAEGWEHEEHDEMDGICFDCAMDLMFGRYNSNDNHNVKNTNENHQTSPKVVIYSEGKDGEGEFKEIDFEEAIEIVASGCGTLSDQKGRVIVDPEIVERMHAELEKQAWSEWDGEPVPRSRRNHFKNILKKQKKKEFKQKQRQA